MQPAGFLLNVDGSLPSMFAKSRLLYTHDPTLSELCARMQEIGERDTQLQLLTVTGMGAKMASLFEESVAWIVIVCAPFVN